MAEEFAVLAGSHKVKNINSNFLDCLPPENEYDIIVLVDIVYQLIAAMETDSEEKSLEWIRQALKDNVSVLFEIEDFSHTIEEVKKWGGGDLSTVAGVFCG